MMRDKEIGSKRKQASKKYQKSSRQNLCEIIRSRRNPKQIREISQSSKRIKFQFLIPSFQNLKMAQNSPSPFRFKFKIQKVFPKRIMSLQVKRDLLMRLLIQKNLYLAFFKR